MDSRFASKPLLLSDLVPCMHIEVRDEHGNRLYHGHVKEVTDDTEPMVILHDETHHRDTTRFAADIGLKPYASGRWSDQQRTYLYTTDRRPSEFLNQINCIPQEAITA